MMITFNICHSEGTITREPEQRKKKCVTFNDGKNDSICPTFPEEEGIRKSKDFRSQKGVKENKYKSSTFKCEVFLSKHCLFHFNADICTAFE